VQNLIEDLKNQKKAEFDPSELTLGTYRPFQKMWLYKERQMVWTLGRIPSLFPNTSSPNLFINVTGPGATVEFSSLINQFPPNYHSMDTGQCYPLYFYIDESTSGPSLFDNEDGFVRTEGITDWALKLFREKYGKSVTKEDVFYYVYGVLSSPEYVRRFKNELRKESPRVPMLSEFTDYVQFGRKLSELHLNYENLSNDSLKVEINQQITDEKKLYRVEKIRFGQGGDKKVIHFNQFISVKEVPEEVYSYLVNGKSPVEWIIDRYAIKEDVDSGNLNDPNDFSDDPKYVFKLLLSVIAMSTKIIELQKTLPRLVIPDER
jgi:predicted helicase